MVKSKGFTLIELLAAIIILAIILAITIPSISRIIGGATREAFKIDAKMVLEQLDYELLQNSNFNVTSVTEENIDDLKLSNANYEALSVKIVNTKPYIFIVGKNKWNGLKACGTKRIITVVSTSDTENCVVGETYTDYIASEGVNKPKLAPGMIPVKWVTDHWVTTTEDDADWYQYGTTTATRNWANVIQVSNPSSYTESGTTVDVANDVIAFWVWIPRYVYKISAGWHEQMTSTTGGTIEVLFSMDTDDTRGGTVSLDTGTTAEASNAATNGDKYTDHPAFWWDNDSDGVRKTGEELTGIWVAKFEASNDGGSNINVKPNVSSWNGIAVSDIFNTTRNMETNNRYGWGSTGANIDTHMMKNIEWGAVAYLTQSSYGINGNIGINNNSNFTTGCGAASGSSSSSNCNTYNTATGMLASTTGNTYGIYDMAGGTYEYVAGYINPFNASEYGASIVGADAKYKDVYTASTADSEQDYTAYIENYGLSKDHKGDAGYETSYTVDDVNWYGDCVSMPFFFYPWFIRGGQYKDYSTAGVFASNINRGHIGYPNYELVGFRPVVLVGSGV